MKARLFQIYFSLASSFWFLPALMAVGAAGLALLSVSLDHELGKDVLSDVDFVWSGGAEGARSVLSVIAGSIMTVVSIVFSLTITTLAQTSSHFGPRVLRTFTSDRGNQAVLGTFIATFVYCLMVLRTVRTEDNALFVPFVSVNVGLLMALASLGVLIYYIHHVSRSIQADHLIASVAADFQATLPRVFPRQLGERGPGLCGYAMPDELDAQTVQSLVSPKEGYLLSVNADQLMELAQKHQLVFHLYSRPGEFLIKGACLGNIASNRHVDEKLEEALAGCFEWGHTRTPYQDILFPMQQLAEIAAHALSPGINEPFTAMTCIDWMGACLRAVAQVEPPSPFRYDAEGSLRVVTREISFEEIAGQAFHPIRLYGSSNPALMRHLLGAIGNLRPHLCRTADRDALIRHVELIQEDLHHIVNESERKSTRRAADKTLVTLAENNTGQGC